jgi:putative spermidine/putrescine transport system permease protein
MKRSSPVSFIFFGALIVLPFAAGIVYALLYSVAAIGLLNQGFTLHHWKTVLTSPEVWQSFGFTIYISLVSLFLSVALALALTIVMNRKNQNGGASFFLYLPLALPAIVAAFFTFQLLSKSGFVSRVLNALHLTNGVDGFPDWVNDAAGTGIIFAHVLLALSFFIILFQNYYHSEKLNLLEPLALTLGASRAQFQRRVMIPVLLKKTTAPLVLYFIFMTGSFEIPLLLGQQHPLMISVLINRKLSRYNLLDMPQGYFLAILYTTLVALLLLLFLFKRNPGAHAAAP